MTRNHNTAILLLFITTAIIGTAMYPASEKIEMKLNLKKGDKFRIEQVTTEETRQESMGIRSLRSRSQKWIYDLKVTDVKDGNYIIEAGYSKIVIELNSGGMNMKYDSDHPEKNDVEIDKYISPALEHTLLLTVSPDGKVQKVDSFEEMKAKMEKAVTGTDNAERMHNIISPESIKEGLSTTWSYLPGQAISTGDSWEKKLTLGEKGEYTNNNTYILKDVKENTAYLTFSGNSKVENTEQGVSLNLNGNTTGKMNVDLNTGIFKEGNYQQTMSGELTAPVLKNGWPINISTSISLKAVKQ